MKLLKQNVGRRGKGGQQREREAGQRKTRKEHRRMTVSRETEAGEEMRGREQVWRSHLEFLKQTVTGEVRECFCVLH